MKSIFTNLFTLLFVFILILSFVFGIIYLASIGRQTLLYVVKTPYGDNIIKVAEFDTNICQTSLNNMIDKTLLTKVLLISIFSIVSTHENTEISVSFPSSDKDISICFFERRSAYGIF